MQKYSKCQVVLDYLLYLCDDINGFNTEIFFILSEIFFIF